MVTLFLFLFGLSIGSFISCLVYRINNETKGNRSVCDHCQKQLAWYDNIPLLSFLLLRGKCRQCHSPIPVQYFLIELATGLLTVFSIKYLALNLNSLNSLLLATCYLLLIYALIAIFVSDLNYQTVPEIVVWPAIVTALIYDLLIFVHLGGVLSTPSEVLLGYLFSALAAGGLFFLLSKIKIKGRQAMGFGDVEIAFLMGLFLGFPKIIVALYLAFLTGALVGVILIMLGKKKLSSQIAFGPFLVGATIFSFFYGGIIWQKIAGTL